MISVFIYRSANNILKGKSVMRNLGSKALSTSNGLKKITLTLYTKKNCSLCDEAKETIEELYPNQFSIEEVDITKDRDLFRKFKLDIPVFYHNGNFLMQHKVDNQALKLLIDRNSSI